MTRKRFLLTICALVGFAAGMGQAHAKPNFTGDWKLNSDKSNFGPMPAPTSMSMKIDHTDPKMKVATSQSGAQGDMNFELNYLTDGTETTNTVGPMEAKSVAKWEGEALVIDTKLNAGGSDITMKSKWTLSEDGKLLTNAAHLTTPQGEMDLTQVFEKSK
jgi:hypothetical protein